MTRTIRLAVCLAAGLSTVSVLAQPSIDQADEAAPETNTSPVAFVYLGVGVASYSAAANGKLTPAPDAIIEDNILGWASNGKYVFGGNLEYGTIDTLSIASDGALNKVASWVPSGLCDNSFSLELSGKDLYVDCQGAFFQYLSVQESTGKLDYFGETTNLNPAFGESYGNLSFSGNNKFAYTQTCDNSDSGGFAGGGLIGYQRLHNGRLKQLDLGNLGPTPPQEGHMYCPWAMATDPTNHLALVLQDTDSSSGEQLGPAVIASYTIGADGQLTTTSTHKNMPVLNGGVSSGTAITISPSGKLLAAPNGDGEGLEIFHFNGEKPVTTYKTLLPKDRIDTVAWDNNNHLYALGSKTYGGTSTLWVYTITPTSINEAPGSPHSIPGAGILIVLPTNK